MDTVPNNTLLAYNVMKFNRRLKVVNREWGGAGLASGQLSAGPGRPALAQRRCGPSGILQLALVQRRGPASLSAVSAVGAWSVFSVPRAKSIWQSQANLSLPFPPFTIFVSLLSFFFCVSFLHPVCWSCPDVIGAEASRGGGASG